MGRLRQNPPRQAAEAVVAEAISVVEAAARAGVSRTLLYEAIGTGALPSVKLGKRRLVRVEALRRWLEALETTAA